MNIYLAVAALAACWCGVWASPLLPCDGVNQFVAHDTSLCIFYQCANGRAYEYACAKGSRVPSYYTKGASDPCIVKVKKNAMDVCVRCNVTDDPIPGAKNYNICAQFRPCFARGPNCTCIDQTAGSYYCSCPVAVTQSPTPANVPVPYCSDNVCKNGGTCYSLYKNQFCNCPPPYTGKLCEENVCDTMVCNNGICTYDSVGVYCQCEKCFTGACCDSVLPNCSGCSKCVGGANCTTLRTHLCDCNPCPSSDYICSQAAFNKVRQCNLGAATAGHKFTLMFEQNYFRDGDALSALEIYMTAGVPDGRTRNATVTTPRSSSGNCNLNENVLIQPGAIAKVNVPVGCRHDGTGLENYGVVVKEVSNDTLTVYAINRASNSADSFLALPDRRAGTNFVVICYPSFNNQNGTDHQSQFGIVAIEDNTQVNITLSNPSDIPGSKSDHTYIVTLNAAQTYQVQASRYGADLSGSIIVSSKPVHVVSGNIRTSVLVNRPAGTLTLSTDHLVEEVPPADTWGVSFAIVPVPRSVLGYTQTLELVRIVASFDTNCTLYNSTGQTKIVISTFSDWFKEFIVDASDNYFLDCNQPVLIMEITASADETLSNKQNDPAMLYIPAVSQYTNYYVFAPAVYSQTNGSYNSTLVVLAAKPSDYQQISVNGILTALLPQFKPWRRIEVPLAPSSDSDRPQLYGGIFNIDNKISSTIRHPVKQVGFMCLIYCYDDRESIGHVAGSALSNTNDLERGFGLSQWEYVTTLNVTYIN